MAASSEDSDYEDAQQDNDDLISPPVAPQDNLPYHQHEIEGNVLNEEVVDIVPEQELNAAVINPQQPPAFGINAQEIVRRVIDNLWPVVGVGPPGLNGLIEIQDNEEEEDDGMENVDNGYFDEEENGQPETDENSNPAEECNDGAAPPPEFDSQLPLQHAYLGSEMEELQGGRVLFDENVLTSEIPLIVMALQLVPGQILPLTIFHSVFQNAIRRCVLTDKVFGIINNQFDYNSGSIVYKGACGTIAEIYEFQEENVVGTTVFAIKAKGRQRFNVESFRRQADGNLMGKVKIRPEIRLAPFCRAAILDETHRYRFPVKRQLQNYDDDDDDDPINEPTSRKLAKTLSLSSTVSHYEAAEEEAVNADLSEMRDKIREQRKITKFYSVFTPFPYFVYEQFEEPVLVEQIHRKLRLEMKGLVGFGTIIPKDATELSFWLAKNLTMDDDNRRKILNMDNPVQRLKYELDLLSRAGKVLTCRSCQITIAENTDIFSMSVEGPQGTYVNPQGFVHETLTVHKTSNDVVLRGASSTEASWFPGYSWTIAECRSCSSHLGWKFKALGRLKPSKFYGLARRSINFKYNIFREEEELDGNDYLY